MTVTARIEVTDDETGTTYIYTGIKAEFLNIETKFEEPEWPPRPYQIRKRIMERLAFEFYELIPDVEGIVYTQTETKA